MPMHFLSWLNADLYSTSSALYPFFAIPVVLVPLVLDRSLQLDFHPYSVRRLGRPFYSA